MICVGSLRFLEKVVTDSQMDLEDFIVEQDVKVGAIVTGLQTTPLFRRLTYGEIELIRTALMNEAMRHDESASNKALQVLIDDLGRDVSTNDTIERLKDAVGDSVTRSRSMRNIASFISRNQVVVHCKALIPEQA